MIDLFNAALLALVILVPIAFSLVRWFVVHREREQIGERLAEASKPTSLADRHWLSVLQQQKDQHASPLQSAAAKKEQ